MKNEELILRTLALASQGLGRTWPNPLVGAVIVKNGKVIGEGFHNGYGLDHAEVDALKNCTESPQGATLYVNLEPCCHTNKQTPPCAQRLITEKIKKVVICNLDPNPLVNGKGVELLKQHGLEVEHGILNDEGEKLNEAFFFAQRSKLPFVHLKLATTLDGKISLPSGESKWITGPVARNYVHELRSQHQAVMAGAETIRKDNPKLNVRLLNFSGQQPYRLVFTKSGSLPQDAQVLSDELKERTLIFSQAEIKFDYPSENIIRIKNLTEAMNYLMEKKIMSLFLEGGSNLATAFLKEDLVNRISLFLNPSLLGAGHNALGDLGLETLDQRPKLTQIESRWMDGDLLISGRLT
jgi:diaminohydroxyphosphoribosylaminopyrimidine deaminase/5-amino-6-(5-phosphoribosylamino)uracil reductase